MKKFKNIFNKVIICLTIVCILSLFSLTAFALEPEIPSQNIYNNLVVSQNFDASKYVVNNRPSYFSFGNPQDVNAENLYFYPRIINFYNWNVSDSSLTTFSSQFMIGYSPLDINFNNLSSSEIHGYLWSSFKYLALHSGLYSSLSDLEKSHIDNMNPGAHSYFIYVNPSTLCTEFIMVQNLYDSLNGYQVFDNWSLGIVNTPPGKYTYSFSNSGQVNNHIYKIILPQNPTVNNLTYKTARINNSDCWISNYNLIYTSVPSKLPFSVDSTTTPNYYLFNNFNKAAYSHFYDSVILFGANGNILSMFNYVRPLVLSLFNNQYYIPFKFYIVGSVENFDFSNFFSSMNFLSVNFINSTSATDLSYRFISASPYIDSVTGNRLTCIDMHLIFTSVYDSNSDGALGTLAIDYFTSLEWSTWLPNNSTEFQLVYNNNDNTNINDAWSNLTRGLQFLSQITENLYIILPGEVYSFLIVAVTLVIILGTLRVVTG